MTASLRGIRVVDVTTSVAGPFATQILGDLGAEVMKVERPDGGDDTRSWGPPFWEGESAVFLALNRNKRSVALDLKAAEGQEVFRRLVADADVVVQNLRPRAFDALGFSYKALRDLNPRLVYCEINGYGVGGPMAEMPAYDPLMQAFGGLMSLTGEEGRPPVRVPASILDQGTAMWAVIAVLDALRTRESTGCGAHVQTSLLNTALMWLPSQLTGYLATGQVPGRLGSGTTSIAPYQAFPTSDGYIIVAAGNDSLWGRLCEALARTDLTNDSRFVDNPSRVAHRSELAHELSTTLLGDSTQTWHEVLSAVGVPTTPIQTIDEVVAHPQVRAIGALAAVPHPRIDDFAVVNAPMVIDGAYPEVAAVPPLLGEHTREVLREHGYTDEDVAALVTAGVAAAPDATPSRKGAA